MKNLPEHIKPIRHRQILTYGTNFRRYKFSQLRQLLRSFTKYWSENRTIQKRIKTLIPAKIFSLEKLLQLLMHYLFHDTKNTHTKTSKHIFENCENIELCMPSKTVQLFVCILFIEYSCTDINALIHSQHFCWHFRNF